MIFAQIIGNKLPSLAYVSTASQAVTSSGSFSGQAIGTPAVGRNIIVAVSRTNGAFAGTSAVTSFSLDGAPMSLLASVSSVSLGVELKFYGIAKATGTTGTFSVTLNDSNNSTVAIGVWNANNLKSLTPTATSNSSAGPAVLDLNVQPHGLVLASASGQISGGTYSWTSLTERYENATNSASLVGRSYADSTSAAGASPLAIQCAYSTSNSTRRALAIALR